MQRLDGTVSNMQGISANSYSMLVSGIHCQWEVFSASARQHLNWVRLEGSAFGLSIPHPSVSNVMKGS